MYTRGYSFSSVMVSLAVLFAIAAAPIGVSAAGVNRAAAPRVAVLELPITEPSSMAISSRTGAACAVATRGDSVVVYPRFSDGSVAGGIKVNAGTDLGNVVYKSVKDQGFFIVASARDQTLTLIDEQTAKIVQKFSMKGPCAYVAAPSSVDVPLAFYAMSDGRAIGCINLEKRTDLGPSPIENTGGSFDPIALWSSADGKYLYGKRRNASPSGIFAYRVEGGGGAGMKVTRIGGLHDSGRDYVVDPGGQWVAYSKATVTADMSKELEHLPEIPMLALPGKPFVIAESREGLVVISLNSSQIIATLPIPEKFRVAPEAAGREERLKQRMWAGLGTYDAILDEHRGQIVLLDQNRVALIPLSLFNLPDEPLLSMRIDGPTEAIVGQKWNVKLVRSDAKIQIEMLDAPLGMKFDGAELVWIPTADNIGPATLNLRMSHSNDPSLEKRRQITLQVRWPGFDVGFGVEDIALSPDRKLAVLIGHELPSAASRRQTWVQTPMAVVDLAQGKLIARRVLDAQISQNRPRLIIYGDEIYLPLSDSDAVMTLKLADLSDGRRIFTTGRIDKISAVGALLFTSGRRNNNEDVPTIYSLPDVAPVKDAPATDLQGYYDYAAPPLAVPGGWFYRGYLFDPPLKKRTAIIVSGDFLNYFVQSPNGGNVVSPREAYPKEALGNLNWGATIEPMGNVQRTSGQLVRQLQAVSPGGWGSAANTVLTDKPVAIALTQTGMSNDQTRIDLIAASLTTGDVLKTVAVFDPPRPGSQQGEMASMMRVGVDQIIVAAGSRVAIVPLDQIANVDTPEPIHFTGYPPIKLFDPARESPVVTFTARGGKGRITYALAKEAEGISIDANSGKLTLDPAKLLPLLCPYYVDIARNRRGGQQDNLMRDDPEKWLTHNAELDAAAAQAVLGVTTTKPVIGVVVNVQALDEQRATAAMTSTVLLELPADQMTGRLPPVRGRRR